ncbi:uncharacterized protein LOC142973253 [Anticarsia gemmatalis]|uniref:uncharacterized protein LOC142973253 n=1 Tax=Anticarsia gemmatalis TaxID=129554 RepID=UPI003F767D87
MKNTPKMVKGARLSVRLAMVFMAFVTVPLTSCLGAQIKKFAFSNNGFGTYSFEYETSDGTYRREEGGLVSGPQDIRSMVVRGEYRYIDSNGKPYTMRYIADANGYQPSISDNSIRFNDRRIILYIVLNSLIKICNSAIYTYEDIELRRIFPSEFPQDTIRKSGSPDPEHLGRYAELKNYFKNPHSHLNSHFEELVCYEKDDTKLCKIDVERYAPEEDSFYLSKGVESHVDRRRFVIFALIAAAWAAPQQNPQDVQIVRYDVNNAGLDSYSFAWELSDGSKHEEQGQLKNQGTENEAIAVQGQYAWVGPDGVTYTVNYIADENGFQPTIEQGPGGAVPSAVVASLLG